MIIRQNLHIETKNVHLYYFFLFLVQNVVTLQHISFLDFNPDFEILVKINLENKCLIEFLCV